MSEKSRSDSKASDTHHHHSGGGVCQIPTSSPYHEGTCRNSQSGAEPTAGNKVSGGHTITRSEADRASEPHGPWSNEITSPRSPRG